MRIYLPAGQGLAAAAWWGFVKRLAVGNRGIPAGQPRYPFLVGIGPPIYQALVVVVGKDGFKPLFADDFGNIHHRDYHQPDGKTPELGDGLRRRIVDVLPPSA